MAATKIKVIELAKELGVTSKDLMVAAEEMGHKGVRAMTPLDHEARQRAAGEARQGSRAAGRDGGEAQARGQAARLGRRGRCRQAGAPVPKKTAEEAGEDAVELRPAATIVKPKPDRAGRDRPRAAAVAKPAAEIAPEPPRSRRSRRPRQPRRSPPVAPPPLADPPSPPHRPRPRRRRRRPCAGPSRRSSRSVRSSGRRGPSQRRLRRAHRPDRSRSRASRRGRRGPGAPPPPPRPAQPVAPRPRPPGRRRARPHRRRQPRPPPAEVLRPAAAASTVVAEPPPAAGGRGQARDSCACRESVTVAELAEKMRRKSGEVIKALIELGVMETVNELLDPTEAKLVADKFHFDLEIRSVEGDVLEEEESDPAQLRAAAAGRHRHGPRRPRQDLAPRRHPHDQGGREGVRRHHAAHRRLPGGDQPRQGHVPGHAGPRGVHGHAGPRGPGHRHRHPGGGGRRRRDAADGGGDQPRARRPTCRSSSP